METIEVKKITENNHSVIAEETINTITEIDNFVQHNEYRYNKSPFELLKTKGLFKSKSLENRIKEAVGDLSVNQLKKLKRSINIFRFKPTLHSANRFYHTLFRDVLNSSDRVRINYSVKQLNIISARKKYVEARKVMLELLDEYKTEKGDFYKQRLANNQNLI